MVFICFFSNADPSFFEMFELDFIEGNAPIALGVSPLELASLRYYYKDLRDGAFAVGAPTDHVREVAGVEPEDFESTVRRYVHNPSLIHPVVKVGSKLEAIRFLGRMLATRPADVDAWERDRGYPLLKDPVFAYDSAEWRATAERQQLNLLAETYSAARAAE